MKELELAETVRALRAEIMRAASAAEGADFQFPVKEVQIEFHVGVTKSAEGTAGVKFWVVELRGWPVSRSTLSHNKPPDPSDGTRIVRRTALPTVHCRP